MTGQLSGKRFAVMVDDAFGELEAWYPAIRLRQEGATVVVTGRLRGRRYIGSRRYPIGAEPAVTELDVDDLHAGVLAGGYALDTLRTTEEAATLLRGAMKRQLSVAAICHAAWLLISADVIAGRTTTGVDNIIEHDVVNASAKWKDEEVVRAGNLVTSREPRDLPVFARTLIEVIQDAMPAAV